MGALRRVIELHFRSQHVLLLQLGEDLVRAEAKVQTCYLLLCEHHKDTLDMVKRAAINISDEQRARFDHILRNSRVLEMRSMQIDEEVATLVDY